MPKKCLEFSNTLRKTKRFEKNKTKKKPWVYFLVWVYFCIQNKKENIVSVFKSPSQNDDEFDNFLLKFEQVLYIILLFVLVTDDFSDRAENW